MARRRRAVANRTAFRVEFRDPAVGRLAAALHLFAIVMPRMGVPDYDLLVGSV